MRILFVTRKYPPSTGGMQNAAYELYKALAATDDVTLFKWGGSVKALPVIYPLLFVRALFSGLKRKPDVIYLQDGVMAPLGWLLKVLLRRPTVITIHGKEATYGNPIYKLIVPPFVKKQTVVTAVSNETRQIVEAAIPGVKPLVIFNGVSDGFYVQPSSRPVLHANVAAALGMTPQELGKYKIVHTHGRLVRRKGVLWFVDEVMPRLLQQHKVLYLVSGGGKDKEVIEAAIADKGLQQNVRMLGRVPDDLMKALYNVADVFAMPNIPVQNDMEGFGLVAVEAASCGTMVVASNLEGIPDAIVDGKNGRLVEPMNETAFAATVGQELGKRSLPPEAVREYTLQHYSWHEVARQYQAVMRQIAGGR